MHHDDERDYEEERANAAMVEAENLSEWEAERASAMHLPDPTDPPINVLHAPVLVNRFRFLWVKGHR